MMQHPDHLPANESELQGVFDAIELAFLDTPLVDCSPDEIPGGAMDEDAWLNCKIHQKISTFPETQRQLNVVHFTYDALYYEQLIHENNLVITWQNEVDTMAFIFINLTDGALISGSVHDPIEDTSAAEGEMKAKLIELTKQLLASVTQI